MHSTTFVVLASMYSKAPRDNVSWRFAGPEETAYTYTIISSSTIVKRVHEVFLTLSPILEAYWIRQILIVNHLSTNKFDFYTWTAKWPKPPIPCTRQRSPGDHLDVLKASKTVAPAQQRGANSAYDECSSTSSGMLITAVKKNHTI